MGGRDGESNRGREAGEGKQGRGSRARRRGSELDKVERKSKIKEGRGQGVLSWAVIS